MEGAGGMEEASIPRQRAGDVLRQYYIAVDRQQFKMVALLSSNFRSFGTFLDLLDLFSRRAGTPLVICCNARDSLDAVFAAVTSRLQCSAKFLHSDLGEDERAMAIDEFRRAISDWKKGLTVSEDGISKKLFLLVSTDACLPSSTLGEQSLAARAMINYDLPVKKEAYLRRLSACLSSPSTGAPQNISKTAAAGSNGSGGSNTSGIVINMMVGGEVGTLKSIEESCGVVIDEMPINIIELL